MDEVRPTGDVLSVLAAMRGQLDETHLDRWAGEWHVGDLPERAGGGFVAVATQFPSPPFTLLPCPPMV